MDLGRSEADQALESYRASRSVEGRFLTYCRRRSHHFWTRQTTILMLLPVFLYATGFWASLLAATVSLLGEVVDSLVLRRIGRRSGLGARLSVAMGVATVTAGLQAASHSVSVAILYAAAGSDAAVLAGAICFAGILDAALLLTACRSASLVRITVYLVTLVAITFRESTLPSREPEVLFDAMSILFLLGVCWLIVRHVLKTKERRHLSRMDMLEKARELAHLNAALARSRKDMRRLAMIAERANDSVILTDRNGDITWVNRAFTEVTGHSLAEAVGRNVTFLNSPDTDDAVSRELHQARSELRPARLEIANRHKDGHTIWIETSMYPIFDTNGDFLNIVSIERDVSDAKERELALAEARRAAEDAVLARRNFLATMSHEIRTPMNGVIGTTDLLLETGLDEQQRVLVQTISSSGEALLAIINDILDFSKLESGLFEVAREPFAPEKCLRSAVEMVRPMAEAKKLDLGLVLPSSLPARVVGDGRRLVQVLLNLLGNAIKFTEHGSIGVDVSVRLEDGQCEFLISVRDTGIGIVEDQLDRIFESFVQADSNVAGRFGGTGLGLPISRLLMQAMGGEITVASEPGKGSVFCLSLTLPEAEVAKAEAPEEGRDLLPANAGREFAGLRILVAEDNRTNTLLIERMLSGTGAVTAFATTGREALELFKDFAPDIILMDLHMPILDGLEATRQIRAIEARSCQDHIPVVALTANAFPEDRDLCMDAGMNGVVTKPFRRRDLFDAIVRHCPENSCSLAVGVTKAGVRRTG